MAQGIRVGIIGGGWPGLAHARAYQAVGGFQLLAVADLIPERRKAMMAEFAIPREYAEAAEVLRDVNIDAISLCVPNHLHAPLAVAALRQGKHVLCEKPPGISAKEARQIESAAAKNGKTVLYAFQRRFGPGEQACHQAIEKGYAGEVYHARAVLTRTRGIPVGTGWYAEKSKSGGGALIDIGIHVLDAAWYLLGQPKPTAAFAITHQRFKDQAPADLPYDVEDAAIALIRFEGGKSIELTTSWAINQPPTQNGTVCRIYGDKAALEVYTPQGAVIFRSSGDKGEMKDTPLKMPKHFGHAAMLRHFKDCIQGKATPIMGPKEGVVLMQMLDAIYKSAEMGKSVEIK